MRYKRLMHQTVAGSKKRVKSSRAEMPVIGEGVGDTEAAHDDERDVIGSPRDRILTSSK